MKYLRGLVSGKMLYFVFGRGKARERSFSTINHKSPPSTRPIYAHLDTTHLQESETERVGWGGWGCKSEEVHEPQLLLLLDRETETDRQMKKK